MDSEIILKKVQDPASITATEKIGLQEIVDNYPYFQLGHYLYLASLKLSDSDEFKRQLEKSIIHITDREQLFEFLTEVALKNPDKKEIEEETQQEKQEQKEQKSENKDEKKPQESLKAENVKRKIKDGAEHMGENLAVTISSQIDHSHYKEEDELEMVPEIYFIDEEEEKEMEENAEDKTGEAEAELDEISANQNETLLEIDEDQEETKAGSAKLKGNEYFNINKYDDLQEDESDDLISQFIKKNPKLEKPKEDLPEEIEDISEESVQEKDDILTEKLAMVFLEQKKYEKAKETYKKLSLKYPEKSSYFADQIQNIEKLIIK